MQIFVTGGVDLRGPSRKSPTLQASLGLLVASTCRDMVPEGQFRVCGDIARVALTSCRSPMKLRRTMLRQEWLMEDAVSSFEDSKSHFLGGEMHDLPPEAVYQCIRAASCGFFQRDGMVRENPNNPDDRRPE
jgi:hypothetical protein